MSSVGTLAKLMERIEQHARNEDDILREDGKVMAEQVKGLRGRLIDQNPRLTRKERNMDRLGKSRSRRNKPHTLSPFSQ